MAGYYACGAFILRRNKDGQIASSNYLRGGKKSYCNSSISVLQAKICSGKWSLRESTPVTPVSDHNYFSITFHTKTSWEKIADNFAIDAYFLLLMSSLLTFKFIHFTHDHDQLLFLLSSVKVNTCQFIPVTAHVGSLLRDVLRFTCFPEIKRKQNKLLIFKTPTCWSIKRITVK